MSIDVTGSGYEKRGKFLANNKRLTLAVTISENQESLVENGYDIAVRSGPLTDSNMYYQSICRSALVLVASPRFLSTQPPIKAPDDLPLDRCFVFDDDHSWNFNKDDEVTVVYPNSGFNTESLSFMEK